MLTFIDLFSGIGGFRLGLEQAGHTCKGHCEIDRFANQSYTAIHQPREGEWFADDIKTVRADDIPRVDLWTFGFPCQDISTAGKQRGMREGTRSGLFFTVTELIKQIEEADRPKWLLIENVKNLLSINRGWDFARVLIEMDELGYDAEWQLLNSKNFGVPQNRERVFIVGHLRGRSGGKVFPIEGENGSVIKRHQIDVSGKGHNSQQDRVYQTDGLMACLPAARTDSKVNIIIEDFYKGRETRTYDNESPTIRAGRKGLKVAIPVLTPDRAEKRQNGRRFKTNGEPSFTLTAQDRQGVMIATVQPVDRDYNKKGGKREEHLEFQKDNICQSLRASVQNERLVFAVDDAYSNRKPRFTKLSPTPRSDRAGLKIKNGTKQGYLIANEGDSINLAFQGSKTRRGRVGKQIANTIDTGRQQGVLVLANGTKEGNTYAIDANYAKGTSRLDDGRRTMVLRKPDWIPGPDDINRTLRKGGSNSLSAKHNYDSVFDGYRIRRLTPRERWRLQGFPDWAFERAKAAGVSNSQLYAQAGNSVTVNVIRAIGERMKEEQK